MPGGLPQKNLKWSSLHYVPMKQWREEDDKPTPTRIMSARNCGHETTVCEDCVDSWAEDWIVYFRRTVGGRMLLSNFKARYPGRRLEKHTEDDIQGSGLVK